MIKDERGNILCENHDGKRQYLNPSVVKNNAWMRMYKWRMIEVEPAPNVIAVDSTVNEKLLNALTENAIQSNFSAPMTFTTEPEPEIEIMPIPEIIPEKETGKKVHPAKRGRPAKVKSLQKA